VGDRKETKQIVTQENLESAMKGKTDTEIFKDLEQEIKKNYKNYNERSFLKLETYVNN
jgi:hypothetical protein